MIPHMSNRGAVVTGCGVINAIANDFSSFGEAMSRAESGLGDISTFPANGLRNPRACEAKGFDAEAIRIKRGDKRMDRSSALTLAAFDQAMEMAQLDPATVNPRRGAVLSGSTLGGARTGMDYYRGQRAGKRRPSTLRDYSLHSPGYRLCIETGFMGPNLVYSTACTSSNLALATAQDLIRAGKADVVLVAGFDPMSEVSAAGFSVMRNVSPELCRPFDKDRQGLVLGEGSALMIVEAEDFAAKRGAPVMAKLRGYGLSSDAHHMTAPDVTAQGPMAAMRKALEMGGAEATQVDFICAHGTGTLHNDAIEAKALHGVLGERAAEVPTASIKSMVGHTLGAAGTMNAVAAMAARAKHIIPPTVNFREAEANNPLSCAPEARPGPPSLVLSNTLGFGGSNCSVLMELA
ncbi:beta-ketoacyl synthase [Phaeobacter sp.]|uniref:beta-ketoacyl-[acyl-carrier-protein] synthase family protein n=1 Tax=Phaeobacter sp. TaxID=1902409 RepID=UPI0025EC3888|nr:beta-ketoacyl-[acyl-carrier-protein] synthase family protein [Phaeobacter sp.]